MKKKILAAIATCLLAANVQGQDFLRTQYMAAPLLLNPAMSGLTFPDDLRASASYYNQSSITSHPITSAVASFDMAIMRDWLRDGDGMGFGLVGIYDGSGTGGLQNSTVGLSLAFHRGLGMLKATRLSMGFQAFVVEKQLNLERLTQHDWLGNDDGSLLLPKQRYSYQFISYPDYNGGITYSGLFAKGLSGAVGYSLYHFTQPHELFMDKDRQIGLRQTAFLSASYRLNESFLLTGNGAYQTQSNVNTILVGATVGYLLNPGHDLEFKFNRMVYLGAYYRANKSIAPYAAFEWDKMTLSASYEIKNSNLDVDESKKGAFELSFVYMKKTKSRTDNHNMWINPNMY